MNTDHEVRLYLAAIVGLGCLFLAACSDAEPAVSELRAPREAPVAPPPMPEGRVSETFVAADMSPEPSSSSHGSEQGYWGINPGEPLPIMWDDLMPEGSAEALEREYAAFYQMLEERYAADGPIETIEEGSELDYMPQLGGFDTVTELDSVFVRIPGYVVPFDFDPRKRHTAFLLVPYMGACIHSPPPPAKSDHLYQGRSRGAD